MSQPDHPHPHTPAGHDWFYPVRVAWAPGESTPVVEQALGGLQDAFGRLGHTILPRPQDGPDILLTTARFGQPLNWRSAYMFTGRARLKLDYSPMVVTLLHATTSQFQGLVDHFNRVLPGEPHPADYDFPGLGAQAYQVLSEQGRRGGAMMAIVRLVQVWSKCFRNVLLVGDDRPREAYLFDLVGAFPRLDASDPERFYEELALRLLAGACTKEVTAHQVDGRVISHRQWQSLSTPRAMAEAGARLGELGFFTEMVSVAKLANVPAMDGVISSQYSEGCFVTWDPDLQALVATITGSARPVEKYHLSDDELAVISGLRPDGLGARLAVVEGKRNDPPSSEAVEMVLIDSVLPRQTLGSEWGRLLEGKQAPVIRSKLHGHRGVRSYDTHLVEHVYLDPAYYDYPVSCSTQAQAMAIQRAFSRSQALANPSDPRQLVFTILPGHGLLAAEKWAPGKQPFQAIWEAIDSGALQVEPHVPQGRLAYHPERGGRMKLVE